MIGTPIDSENIAVAISGYIIAGIAVMAVIVVVIAVVIVYKKHFSTASSDKVIVRNIHKADTELV